MAQLTYSDERDLVGYNGQQINLANSVRLSAIVDETNGISYGKFVKLSAGDSSNGYKIKNLSAAADLVLGLALPKLTIEQRNRTGTDVTQLLEKGIDASVGTSGTYAVKVAEAVIPGKLYVRFAVDGTKTDIGGLAAAASATHTIEIKSGRVLTTTAKDGFAIIQLD